MTLILLEALLAGLILVAIVWWTMFAGRRKGELKQEPPQDTDQTFGKEPPPKDGAPRSPVN